MSNGDVEVMAEALVAERRAVPTRFKIRFPSADAMNAAMAAEAMGTSAAVILPKRQVVSVDVPAGLVPELSDSFQFFTQEFGAEVVEDFRYHLEDLDFFNPLAFKPDDQTSPSLDDVIQQIRATSAWAETRGQGVTLAIVDTGIDDSRPEFPISKRHPKSWAPLGEKPWSDWQGHGTMCATIAGGTKASGGVFDGVAPDATILSCRTHFYDTELAAIYDLLADLATSGETVVASNSFGLQTGTPPRVPENSDFLPALQDALDAGVYVFFSAGNYHHLAGGLPQDHTPNTVWLHKGRSDIFTVGAAKPDSTMWYYSSRGPGQFIGEPGTDEKPDAVGVTPPDGRVVYGGAIKSLADGWGTSGCCPQAAGLAALILSKGQQIGHMPDREDLFAIIRDTCVSLGHHPHEEGRGRLDCAAAVAKLTSP